MQSATSKTISISPEELVFVDTVVGTGYSKSLTIKNNISANIELVGRLVLTHEQSFKSSSADRTEVVPKTKVIAPYESATIDIKVKLTKPFPKKGRSLQNLKDYIYIKSNYFDTKVPVHILPQERSESLEPRLRSSLSPRRVSSRLPRPSAKEADLAVTSKSVESQLEEQSARAKVLQEELEKARQTLVRKEEEQKEQRSASPRPDARPGLGTVLEEEAKDIAAVPVIAATMQPQVTTPTMTPQMQMTEEEETLNKIRQILKDKHPSLETLMDISLKQEREKHERQNEKVLQILKIKDGLIEELQQKLMAGQRGDAEELERQCKDLQRENGRLQTREQQLVQTVAEHEETIKLLSESREQLKANLQRPEKFPGEDLEKANAELRQKLEILIGQGAQDKETIERLSKELAEAQRKVAELKKREDYVLELANRQEDIKRRHEEQMKKADEQLEQAQKQTDEQKAIVATLRKELQKLEETTKQLQDEQAESKKLETELSKLQEEKAELEGKMQEMEEVYRSDNEKLATLVKQFKGKEPVSKADKSFTMEDLKSTSKDYMGRVQDQIEQQQRRVEELTAKNQELEAKVKLSEDVAVIHQADKTALVSKYAEEIARQQKTILELQSKQQKILKSMETQTALKGDNVSDLTRLIEDYKGKLECSAEQREEREKYISELEKKLKQQTHETERAKTELDSVVKHYEEANTGLSQLEQNEVVTKLNSRVSALQIQVHQLQSKLKEAEEELAQRKQAPAPAASTKPLSLAPTQSAVNEHMADRVEALEIVVVQLREEIIQLEVEKRNLEQSLRLELDTKEAKVKALEGLLNANLAKDPSMAYSAGTKLELEKTKEQARMLEGRLRISEQELTGAQKELIRVRQTEKLANVLPSDGEIAMKLTNKIKTQRGEIRHLQALLKRAKLEFDKLSTAMQARTAPVGESRDRSSVSILERGKDEGQEWDRLSAARNEQLLAEANKRCDEFRRKLNDSLRVMLELKEEFSHKLMEKEERHQRQLYKLAEECRQRSRDAEVLEHKLSKMAERLLDAQTRAEAAQEQLNKSSAIFADRIHQLEDALTKGKRTQDETHAQVKKHELVIQERSAQIAVLMETIETIQKGNKDATAQKYLNANVELCSARAMYAKLETRNAELEALYRDAKRSCEEDKKREAELKEEHRRLTHELAESKQLLEGQAKQVEKLEEAVEEGRMESANNVARIHGLEEQLKAKEKRVDMFKTQLAELQQASGHLKKPSAVPSSVKASKSPAASLLNTSISRQWGPEETKDYSRQGEGKQIAVMLKQLLAEIQKEFEQIPVEQRQSAVFQRMSAVILRSDQVISDLERNNAELEQKLAGIQTKGEERVAYEKVLLRCDALASENTELNLMVERLISTGEGNKLEYLQKLQRALSSTQQALRSADLKIISLSEQNCALKTSLQEAQDKLDTKTKDAQVVKVKLEKELSLARIKAEEEMSLKLSIRNEEMKTYFDTHVSKLILGKEDGGQILSLTREVCAQKLLVEKLQMQLSNADKAKAAVEEQVQELLAVLARNTAQLEELQFAECQKLRKKTEQFAGYSKDSEILSKRVLRAQVDQKRSELAELNAKIHELKEENSKLRIVLEKGSQDKSGKAQGGSIIEELESKIATLNSSIEEKEKAIEALEKRLIEMSSEHALEMQNMQSDIELRLQDERKNLMQEFDTLAKKYKPGEAPGEIVAENQALKTQCLVLRQNVEKLETEQVVLRQKVDSLSEDCGQYRNEAELYKKALAEMQEVTNAVPEQSLMSTGKLRSGLMTPAEKKGKDPKKKLVSGEKQAIKSGTEEGLGMAKAETSVLKLPRFVKALMAAKYNEADAETRVRKLAKTELELRSNLTKAQQQIKDLETKLRHYERLLKDSNIRITVPPAEAPQDEDISWLKKRVLELEATCEDMKLRELHGLTTYSGVVPAETAMTAAGELGNEQSVNSLLVQGIISLCVQLATTEAQLRERKLTGSQAEGSSYFPSVVSAVEPTAATTERVQRVVIKTLTNLLRKCMGDTAWNAQCTVPTNETDRQVWYLELMEIQTQNVERAVAQLKEYTTKISVEITGSLASAAQVKAAALELANQTKEAAEEIVSLRNLCGLAKRDLEDLVKDAAPGRAATPGRTGELADRLAFAEKVRKSLENEVAQLKLALSYHQTEGKQIVEGTKGEMDRVIKKNRELDAELNSVLSKKQELEKELVLERTANDELRRDLQGNTKKLSDLTSLLEKYKKELKENVKGTQKLSEKEDLIRSLEAKHEVLAGQCEVLMKENKELKDKVMTAEKKTWETQNEAVRALQKENKDLDAKLHAEIEERKTEIEFWIKERAQMRQLIETLKCEKDNAAKKTVAATVSGTKSAITKKGAKPEKKEAGAMSDTESNGHGHKDSTSNAVGDAKRRIKKYREKIKRLKSELEAKAVDAFKLQADIQDLKSKLHIAELNTEEERRKVVSLSSELRDMQMHIRQSTTLASPVRELPEDVPKVSRAQLEELKTSLEATKQQMAKLEQDVYERAKREEELKQERDKMVVVIQELDREAKMKEKECAEIQSRLDAELQQSSMQLSQKEKELADLQEKQKEDAERIAKYEEELKAAKEQAAALKEEVARIDQSHKELEAVVIKQEEAIEKMKQEASEREKEVKKELDALQTEYKETKRSADERVALYETQLRLVKEKFKEEYMDLTNKLTIQSQGKGATVMSPKKKEQNELSVDLMFQISQKDGQIKTLEKEIAKLKAKSKTNKAAVAKLQGQLKEAAAATVKPKPRPSATDTKKRTATGKLPETPTAAEEQMKSYNLLMKEKTELELKLNRIQNTTKTLESKLQMEKERVEEAELKIQIVTKECEELKESLRNAKKEQSETAKKHKAEMQKMLDELVVVKNSWKSPEELGKCQEEKKELETQLKAAKDELARKKELMKQWKEKEELRQSEAGQLMAEVGAAKDDTEKLKKAVKELTRKDQTIKSLKTAMETGKGAEKQLAEENKALVEKLKAAKAELARKDTALKAFKEKTDEAKSDKENVKGKDTEIEKLKLRITSYSRTQLTL